MLVLGILMAIAIPMASNIVGKANETKCQANFKRLLEHQIMADGLIESKEERILVDAQLYVLKNLLKNNAPKKEYRKFDGKKVDPVAVLLNGKPIESWEDLHGAFPDSIRANPVRHIGAKLLKCEDGTYAITDKEIKCPTHRFALDLEKLKVTDIPATK